MMVIFPLMTFSSLVVMMVKNHQLFAQLSLFSAEGVTVFLFGSYVCF